MYKGGAGAVLGPWGSAWGDNGGAKPGTGTQRPPKHSQGRGEPADTRLAQCSPAAQPRGGGSRSGEGSWKSTSGQPHCKKNRVFPPKCSHSPSGRLRRVPQPLGLDLGLAAGRGVALGGEAPGGLHGAGEGSVGFPPSMPIPEATRHGPGDRLEDSTVCPGGPTGRGGQRGPEQGRVPLPARGRAGTGGRSLKANVLLAPRACGILGPGASQRLLSSCIQVQTSAGACLPHSKTSL